MLPDVSSCCPPAAAIYRAVSHHVACPDLVSLIRARACDERRRGPLDIA
jgi:hypothetical protein